jgi:hypothetical protein
VRRIINTDELLSFLKPLQKSLLGVVISCFDISHEKVKPQDENIKTGRTLF